MPEEAPVTENASEPDVLDDLGLASTELRAYRYLLAAGTATPTMIARGTGQSRGRIYETLENLVARGFARSLPTRPIQYQPTPLPEVLALALSDEMRRTQAIRQAYETAGPLDAAPRATPGPPPGPSPPTSPQPSIPDSTLTPEQAEIKLYESILRAKVSVRCMGAEGWSNSLTRDWQQTVGVYAKALRRGVEFRALTTDNAEERPILDAFRAIWQMRMTEWVPGFIIIVDEAHLFQAKAGPDGKLSWLRYSDRPEDIRFYGELFERMWTSALPWSTGEPVRMPQIGEASTRQAGPSSMPPRGPI